MNLGDIIKEYTDTHSMTDFLRKSGISKAYAYMLINNKNNHGNPIKPTLDVIKKVSIGISKPYQEVLALLDEDTVVTVKATSIEPKGIEIPVLGKVAAGIPIEMIEDIIDTEEITEDMALNGEYFGLKINGDSMEPRLYKGDVVIVRQQEDADSGDIVIVAINGDDATCKRLLKSSDGITLLSLNPKYSPIVLSNKDIIKKPVRIIGKVVEVRGKLEF